MISTYFYLIFFKAISNGKQKRTNKNSKISKEPDSKLEEDDNVGMHESVENIILLTEGQNIIKSVACGTWSLKISAKDGSFRKIQCGIPDKIPVLK